MQLRSIPAFTDDRLLLLEKYTSQFRDVFTRSDQARCFHLYLQGLLDGDHRKNVESIAERVSSANESDSTKTAQSLHHFVNQSPWEVQRVIARYHQLMGNFLAERDRTWVIHDGCFPKKGKHSVGVQRQFARSLGRKVNCQLAVVISQITPHGYAPLAARLYLPNQWLKDYEEVARRTVPEPFRAFASKVEIAIRLLEELETNRMPIPVLVAEDGYLTSLPFQEELNKRNWKLLGGSADLPEQTQSHTADEKRSTVLEKQSQGKPFISASQTDILRKATENFDWLKDHLGIDHFEGRTWHGWHHHVALVIAAYGFLRWELSQVKKPDETSPQTDAM